MVSVTSMAIVRRRVKVPATELASLAATSIIQRRLSSWQVRCRTRRNGRWRQDVAVANAVLWEANRSFRVHLHDNVHQGLRQATFDRVPEFIGHTIKCLGDSALCT